MTEAPYDPLDYTNLTHNLVRELMTRTPSPLPPNELFQGPGVYALFYNGDFTPYASIASHDSTRPIYVGKASPPGGRKGVTSEVGASTLYGRLQEHAESIKQADNLRLEDFRCRYLVTVPLWINMAERFLLEHYSPLWNACIEGFGAHNPGKGRHQGEASWWDTLHPGRSWARNLKSVKRSKI